MQTGSPSERNSTHPTSLFDRAAPGNPEELEAYLHDGRVWRMEIDTYQPEYQRYGRPQAIDPAEEAFEADSDAALSISGACSARDLPPALFWALSRYAHEFGFSPAETLAVWQRLRTDFGSELGADTSIEDQLSRRYRLERRDYEQRPGEAVVAALAARSSRLRQVAGRLKKLEEARCLTSSMQSIVGTGGTALVVGHGKGVIVRSPT
jgi:class I lanthipeptide synthase